MRKRRQRLFLLILIFFTVAGCAEVAIKEKDQSSQKQKEVIVVPPIPKRCGENLVFYGVVKEYTPKSDGFYLDRSGDYSYANLEDVSDPSYLEKTVLIMGELHSLYPPGGKPSDDNHHSIILKPKVLQIINSKDDLWSANKKCSAVNSKLRIENPALYKELFQ